MQVTRVEQALQVAGVRTAWIIRRGGPTFGTKLQTLFEETTAVLRAAVDPQLGRLLLALLTPASMLALVFGLWRVGTDLEWTGDFPISAGLFSHWQVWIALAVALKFAGSTIQARTQAKTSEEN